VSPDAQAGGARLGLRGATKAYGTNAPVLRDVDLDIAPGELVAIVGPSGSGKSTLLHLLGTLDRPTTGAVRIDGRDTGAMSDAALAGLRARDVAFVFQEFHLLPSRNATDNVAQGLLYAGVPRRLRRARAREALDAVGLGHRADHRPSALSGGERQRVAIARALVAAPRVLLADEPTGNLDTAAGTGVVALLRRLHRSGTTVVVITHDRDLAAALPRSVRLLDGRIVEDVVR
jgi:putative ABC transport system ATP-binding protein